MIRFIPDDPGAPEEYEAPMVFGGRAKHHVDSVVRTIRKNAGKMPVDELARALSLSPSALRKLAEKHNIPLRATDTEPEPRGA